MRRCSVVEIETRVVPGAVECLADEQSLLERRTVVRALRANGKPVYIGVHQQHRFAEGVTRNELPGCDRARLDTGGEIGPGQLVRVLAHFRLSSRFCARSRCATKAGATLVTRSFTCAF